MRWRFHLDVSIGAAVILAWSTAIAAAQPAGAPQPPGQTGQGRGRGQLATNLQVLPKDTPRAEILTRMREFTRALGVRCEYCHQQPEGAPSPIFDTDVKIEKQKAREMMRMVGTINNTLLASMPGHTATSARVECVTCHRGLPVPTTLQATLADTMQKSGVEGAIKQYRDLRATQLMSGRYDFSEATLSDLVRGQSQKNDLDGAIALGELNAEFFPNSENLALQLGELYLQKGDKVKALARFKMVVEKNPNNERAKTRIAELEKQ